MSLSPSILSFIASFGIQPPNGVALGAITPAGGPFTETLNLLGSETGVYDLVADAPQAVSFGGLSGVTFIVLQTTGKVDVTLTSADGTAQVIPINDFLMLLSKTTPYTAIALTRATGVETVVQTFLGQTA